MRTGGRDGVAAAAGVGAAAAALGAGELVAAVLRPTASPLLSVGSLVIDLTPGFLKSAVIAAFGTGDKPFLLTVLVSVVLLGGALAGVLEVRRPPLGRLLVVVGAAVAATAAVTRHDASPFDAAPALVDLAVGVLVLAGLLRSAGAATRDGGPARRGVLIGAGLWAAGGVAAGLAATVLGFSPRQAAAAIARVRLPRPASRVAPLPAGAAFAVRGLAPLVTPNADFYRIDIALAPPQLDPAQWTLEVTGDVEHPFRLSYAELNALPMGESRTTLMCVSNEVGGDLIGTATWLGTPIRGLLARARPRAGADMVLSTGSDGFTASTPLSVLTDPGRNAVLAVGMNGAVLPVLHGFPVRMVVPGLYGYVSATKWLTRLEVTRFDRATAYWTNRGYSARAPIKVSSRIDVPRGGVGAGAVTVAGVAWAQHTGIARVQLQIDDGPWRDCELADEVSVDIWRQWRFRWLASRGTHTLRVRATDRRGLVQTAKLRPVAPDGATGLHTVQVTVG
jgi:DMSO/TMAO reductase YedYZ molybdopterin-dependent catalytic subunit